jgi:hypothetical protein
VSRSESHQRAIDQVAVLFPHLSVAERFDWWRRLNCPLGELTVHMPTFEQRLAEAQAARLTRPVALNEGEETPT